MSKPPFLKVKIFQKQFGPASFVHRKAMFTPLLRNRVSMFFEFMTNSYVIRASILYSSFAEQRNNLHVNSQTAFQKVKYDTNKTLNEHEITLMIQ